LRRTSAVVTAALTSAAIPTFFALFRSVERFQVIDNDFRIATLFTGGRHIFTYLEAAFDGDQTTFAEVVCGVFRRLTPGDDAEEVRLFFLSVAAGFRGHRTVDGESKLGDGDAAGGIFEFGVAGQTANQNDAVQIHSFIPLLFS